MIIQENRIKEFITPIRIVKTDGKVENAEVLTEILERQNFFSAEKLCRVEGKGYIILDFGKEIYGTLRIKTNRFFDEKSGNNFRIRFGESLTETCYEIGEKGATNDHSTRDMEIYMSSNSDMEWGNTGFRFVRIDFLVEQTYLLSGVAAGFIHTDAEQKGSFDGNERIKQIYDTAAYTLFLNMQNSIWDGIKRDQHLWVGDFYPEMTGILFSYGDVPLIEESLLNVVSHYALPAWYNNIPAYNIWFMLCVNDYVKYSGKGSEILVSALNENLDQIEKCIKGSGELDFESAGLNYWCDDFFEWPCFGTDYGKTGVFYLLKYTLKKISEEKLFNGDTILKVEKLYGKINDVKRPLTPVKSIEALRVLCGEDVCESLKIIENGGAKGCSMFFTYFILKALADNGKGQIAMDIAKEYYGAMLDKGATTFWENFDIEWANGSSRIDEFPVEGQKDIHGDFGANCYTGFRHSLCHGWSCGIIAFLVENVVGIKAIGKGFSQIKIQPNCAYGQIKCVLPTPYGSMSVEITNNTLAKVEIPKGIEVVS